MKMRRPHRVPLSSQVVGLFEELHDLTGTGSYCSRLSARRDG